MRLASALPAHGAADDQAEDVLFTCSSGFSARSAFGALRGAARVSGLDIRWNLPPSDSLHPSPPPPSSSSAVAARAADSPATPSVAEPRLVGESRAGVDWRRT